MSETRKLTTILAADVAGYSRLTAADEEGTIARLRALRHELIDPVIAANKGRLVKTTGDGRLIDFASVVDAVRCAIEVQRKVAIRNADVPPDDRIEFRVGIHLGDVIIESDGDLMGDGVNIAARLEGICEPGGVCLSEDAYRQARDKVIADFVDLGERSLKNIARPITAYAIPPPSKPSLSVLSGEAQSVTPNQGLPHLSVVVLPFANIGGDPEQEYFVDGVTESLTTDLSLISGSFVIARNTAFTYKGKPIDVKQIGRELKVRYVLEGSVQRGGNRLRVNVQLVEAETGSHLWAERFDKPVADLFEMQDEIVARLANQLQAKLIEVEARRAAQSPHPDSMDLYFQGMAFLNKGRRLDDLAPAADLFERALALDPANVEAMVGRARVDAAMVGGFLTDDRIGVLAAAEARLTAALSLAPNHALAHMVLCHVYSLSGRAAQGVAEGEQALALDRNLANAYSMIALGKMHIGRAEEAEAHILEAFRLSPRDNNGYIWAMSAGTAKLGLGDDESAVAWLRRSIEANRNLPHSHFWLAAALAHLGRLEEARAAVQAGLSLDPTATMRRFRAAVAGAPNPVMRAQAERFFEGMRLAGLPEG